MFLCRFYIVSNKLGSRELVQVLGNSSMTLDLFGILQSALTFESHAHFNFNLAVTNLY
jgi:hypothetical protein